MEAVNTFELGVVPFISRHFVLPTDVDTFRTLLLGEDYPLEAEVSTLRSSRPEEAHPFEQEVSLTFRTSRPEEDHPFINILFCQQMLIHPHLVFLIWYSVSAI